MNSAMVVTLSMTLDHCLGEPRRGHPLMAFGRLAALCERHLNATPENQSTPCGRLRGLAAVIALLAPPTLFALCLARLPEAGWLFQVLALYFALGLRSLGEHGEAVREALAGGDKPEARRSVGNMVSRDTAAMEADDIARAAVESVLENGNDAVFGALFWFVVGGAPGAVLYRLANTLDAMWGYRSERFLHFGWAAARLDDVLNYVPARLTALTYAWLGATDQAVYCWRTQAPAWDSPNAGPVMAAGAGALRLALGGPARYRGELHERPVLGAGAAPTAGDITRAMGLVRRGAVLWLVLLILLGSSGA